MSRQSNSRVATPLPESAPLRVDIGAKSRDRGLMGRRFPRATIAILLLAACALIYQVAAAVLAGAAPAWILLIVIVLSVACLLLADGLQTRRLELRRAARDRSSES